MKLQVFLVYFGSIYQVDRLTFAKSPVMPRFKATNPAQRLFLPVCLDRQLQEGTFDYAIDHIIGNELNLSHLEKIQK